MMTAEIPCPICGKLCAIEESEIVTFAMCEACAKSSANAEIAPESSERKGPPKLPNLVTPPALPPSLPTQAPVPPPGDNSIISWVLGHWWVERIGVCVLLATLIFASLTQSETAEMAYILAFLGSMAYACISGLANIHAADKNGFKFWDGLLPLSRITYAYENWTVMRRPAIRLIRSVILLAITGFLLVQFAKAKKLGQPPTTISVQRT